MDDMDTARTPDNIVDAEDEKPELPTYEELMALVMAMMRDWVKLNEFYNVNAYKYQWCDSYESLQSSYNAQFEVMTLRPRTTSDIDRWVRQYGVAYRAQYKNHYHLTEEMAEEASNVAKVRATYETARLLADQSMKKQPEPQKQPDLTPRRSRLREQLQERGRWEPVAFGGNMVASNSSVIVGHGGQTVPPAGAVSITVTGRDEVIYGMADGSQVHARLVR